MKKYLISIEQPQSLRLRNFFAQPTFAKYQSEFIQYGVIGANLSTKQYFNLAVAGRKKPLSPAELGCTLSHLDALKNFLSTGDKYACIFEDDAISFKDFDLDSLESQISELNLDECFFFSLGGIQLKSSKQVRGTFLEKKINDQPILKLHPIYFGRLFYAYAYIIDRKMAKLLLRYHEIPKGYDHWSHIRDYDNRCQFYASCLFNHPELDEITLNQSYIQQERQLLKKNMIHKKSIFLRWRVSILKKFLKIILYQYPK